jgi:hypothetical protein
LTRVVFCVFFNRVFSFFSISSLGQLGIAFHNLFWFAFYRDILISWSRLWIFGILTPIKSSHFLNFLLRCYLGHELFNIGYGFYWVILISWPRSRVWRVNLVDLLFFLFIDFFFFQFHHLILYLIEKHALWFVLVCF